MTETRSDAFKRSDALVERLHHKDQSWAGTERCDLRDECAKSRGASGAFGIQSARADVTLNQQNGQSANANQDQSGTSGRSAQKYAQMESEVSQRIADEQNQIRA